MLRNRHILCYTTLPLMLMGALCCRVALAQTSDYVNPSGMTIETRFKLPEGFVRLPAANTSYTSFLRNLRLRPDGTAYEHTPPEDKYAGIFHMVMPNDIRQDIHLGVRLWAEYLFSLKQYNKIIFSIKTSAEPPFSYAQWVRGLQLTIGDKLFSTKQTTDVDRLSTLHRYLGFIFDHYDVTAMMADVQRVSVNDIMPGDMFIQPVRSGYAVVVVDVAYNPVTGERIFLLAKNYKSAKSAFILVQWGGSPWYSIKPDEDKLITPEFIFQKTNLRRFRDRQ